jgi:isoquinoline 1-oxidoreductase beta subunit
VRTLWSREDDIKGGYYRRCMSTVPRSALTRRANTGVDHVIVGNPFMAGTPFESFMVKDGVETPWLKA